jgi:hypothetical protein
LGINNKKKEMPMSDTIHVGRRFVPLEHVVLVEPFDPSAQTRLQTEKPYKARLVLLDRDSVLTEQPLDEFVEQHGFRMLADDGIAVSPHIHFTIEAFEAKEGFTPNKPYASRLLWRGPTQEFESKLLLSTPETVLAIAVRGEVAVTPGEKEPPKASRRRRRRASTPAPV